MSIVRGALVTAGAALIAAFVARPVPARAQACCAGGALVTPTRLAIQEEYGVALQTRGRTNIGSFASDGHYAATPGSEQQFEQDLAAAFRFAGRAQGSLLLPTIETHRNVAGNDEWGGGIGDVAVTFRYDLLFIGEASRWPGIGLLAGGSFPTGTAPDQAKKPLATDATGRGTYEADVGLSVEHVVGSFYVALNVWLTYRLPRTVSPAGAAPIHESFGLRWSELAVAGVVFDNRAGLAAFVSALQEGDATVNGAGDPTSGVRLTTVGIAGAVPFRDVWRAQAAVSSDLTISSFGRNQPAGLSVTLSLVRVWL